MTQQIDAYLVLDENSRYYYSQAICSSGCIVIVGDKKTYISDTRYETYLKEKLAGSFDVVIIERRTGFYAAIIEALKDAKAVNVGIEEDKMTYAEYLALQEGLKEGGITLVPASADLSAVRAVKSEAEIEIMTAAQKINMSAMEAAIERLKTGVTEREVAAEIIFEMIKGGADDRAFVSIVSFGANSALPHHSPDNTRLEKGQPVMIDIGCRYKGYCCDMTRTFFWGEPNAELAKIYDIVLGAQKSALQSIKAGMSCHEADALCREYIKSKGYDAFFGHSTGHGVGVNIHEEPSVSPKNEKELKANMIITVEPGIYIPDLGGVRIEDMVVVTENGINNLTPFKKELTVLK